MTKEDLEIADYMIKKYFPDIKFNELERMRIAKILLNINKAAVFLPPRA